MESCHSFSVPDFGYIANAAGYHFKKYICSSLSKCPTTWYLGKYLCSSLSIYELHTSTHLLGSKRYNHSSNLLFNNDRIRFVSRVVDFRSCQLKCSHRKLHRQTNLPWNSTQVFVLVKWTSYSPSTLTTKTLPNQKEQVRVVRYCSKEVATKGFHR